jgi:hypothetical protein
MLWNLDDGIQMVEDTILKSFQPFTLPTGIQFVPDFIMQLIWCGCKSGIPSVQGIVVTTDMALAFWIYMYSYIQIFCACSGSCASLSLSFSD